MPSGEKSPHKRGSSQNFQNDSDGSPSRAISKTIEKQKSVVTTPVRQPSSG